MIRVLVVEDSPTAREYLIRILESDPGIVIVGEARDGFEAAARAAELRPDLIAMDLHMPNMDGLEATREIMNATPTPIVIVTASTRGADVERSMELLGAGALEVMMKPPSPGSPDFEAAAKRLIATVKSMAQVKVVRHRRAEPPSDPKASVQNPVRSPKSAQTTSNRSAIVAVAASTGGPAALQLLLTNLPVDFSLPILVVQHITEGFSAGLASWLDSTSAFRVKLASHNEMPAPRSVYLAPDARHLGVSSRGSIVLADDPAIDGFKPSATFLFDSVGRSFGASAIAVILTGMGEDGVQGLRTIRRTGGRVIAQDEKTSIVFGMPGAAIAAGLADLVLPLDSIPSRLAELQNSIMKSS
jgi:two-component system chemotaxis response regulator CheB